MSALLARFSARTLTEWMARDHAVLDRRLQDVARMVEDGELERADYHFPDADEHARRRIELEESLVFPAFERATGADPDGTTALLRWEHREMRQALAEMRAALDAGDAGDFHRAYEAFARFESQHRICEDRLLFPLVDHGLEKAALADLIARLESNRSSR